jgi:hypothetical protein
MKFHHKRKPRKTLGPRARGQAAAAALDEVRRANEKRRAEFRAGLEKAVKANPGMVVVERKETGLPPRLKREARPPHPDGRHAWQRKKAAAERANPA